MSQTKPEIKHCQSLQEVRIQIDRIDEQLGALIAERQGYVKQAAGFKKTVEEVVVPERIEQIAVRAQERANRLGASTDVAEKTFRAMVAAFIEFERAEYLALHKS